MRGVHYPRRGYFAANEESKTKKKTDRFVYFYRNTRFLSDPSQSGAGLGRGTTLAADPELFVATTDRKIVLFSAVVEKWKTRDNVTGSDDRSYVSSPRPPFVGPDVTCNLAAVFVPGYAL